MLVTGLRSFSTLFYAARQFNAPINLVVYGSHITYH